MHTLDLGQMHRDRITLQHDFSTNLRLLGPVANIGWTIYGLPVQLNPRRGVHFDIAMTHAFTVLHVESSQLRKNMKWQGG